MSDRARLAPALVVSDLVPSLGSWCGLIGFRVIWNRPEDAFADLDGADVMLEQRDRDGR